MGGQREMWQAGGAEGEPRKSGITGRALLLGLAAVLGWALIAWLASTGVIAWKLLAWLASGGIAWPLLFR